MSRPLKKLDTKNRKAIGLDQRTYKSLRSIRDMMSDDLGIEIHLNQVIQMLIKKHIETYIKKDSRLEKEKK
jgi:hypothetical protein